MDGTSVTDEGMRCLAETPALETLGLDGTEITDAGLAHLVAARSLKSLSCSHTRLTDAGLAHVGQMRGLESFVALGSHVTEEAAQRLGAALPQTQVVALPTGSEEARRLAVELVRQGLGVAVAPWTSEFLTSVGDQEAGGLRRYHVRHFLRRSFHAAAVKALKRLTEIEAVELVIDERPSEGLAFLDELPNLQLFSFGGGSSGPSLSEQDLGHLAKLLRLRVLSLAGALPSSGLKQLQPLGQLEDLDLRWMTLGDAELVTLPPLAALERLDLRGTQVSDAGLAQLQKLPRLRMVLFSGPGLAPRDLFLERASGTGITDRGVAELGKLTDLTGLGLSGCGVTDAGLAHLAKLPNLDHLDLSNTQVGDADMVHVARLTKLRYLVLDNTQVTNSGLAQLKTLKNLKRLSLQNTQVDSDAIQEFRAAVPPGLQVQQ